MGLFDAFGVTAEETIAPVVVGRKPGNYPAKVAGARKEEGVGEKKGPWLALVLTYKFDNEELGEIEEYLFLPTSPAPWDNTVVVFSSEYNGDYTEDRQNREALGAIKSRLMDIGVPENKVNDIDPLNGDIDGAPVVIKLVENKRTGYVNIAKKDGVKARRETATVLPTATTPAAAATATTGFGGKW